MSLRAEQRALTRTKILGAVVDLLADGSLDELSVPAVSRRSDVSLATIYRYFPTRDELLAAAAEEPARRAFAIGRSHRRTGDDDLAGFQRTMWTELARNLPLVRHQLASAAGREMRQFRLQRSRELLAGYVTDQGIDPDSAGGKRLVAVLLLISGSLGLVELHDRQGLPVDESVDVAMWAASALIESTRRGS